MSVVPSSAAVTQTLGTPTANAAVEDTVLTVSAPLTLTAASGDTTQVSATLVTKPSASSNSALAAVAGGALATVGGNAGTITGTIDADDANGGLWTVSVGAISTAVTITQTFTITPDTAGSYTVAVFIDADNDGDLDSGETTKYLSFTVVTAPAATAVLEQPLAGVGAIYDAQDAQDGLVVRVSVKNSAGVLTRLASTQQVILTIPTGLTLREKNGDGTDLTVTASDYGLTSSDFNASGYAFLNLTGAAANTYNLTAVIGGIDSSSATLGLTYAAPSAVATVCATTYENADGEDVSDPDLPATTGYQSGAEAATVASTATSTTFRVCAASADVSKLVQLEIVDTWNRIWVSPADLLQDVVVTLGSTAGSASATNGSASKATTTYAIAHSVLTKNTAGAYRSFAVSALATDETDPDAVTNVVTGAAGSISATGSFQELSPAATVRAINGATTTFTATYYNQFGAVVAGAAVTASVSSGRNLSAAATNLITNASGEVSYTVTDANPTSTTTSDVVTFTGGAADVDATILYAASITASTMTMSPVTTSTAPSSSAVYTSTATASLGAVTVTATVKDANSVTIAGLPVTLTYPSDLSLTSTSTAVAYSDSDGVASWGLYTTKAGTYKVTATGGGLTKDVYLKFTGGTARVVSVTAGTTTGDVTPVTIKVADAYGNGVSSTSVTITGTGAGYFQGIALGSSQTTTADGTVTAAWVGSGTITATITGGQSADVAGYVGTTAAAGFPAGAATSTATITGGTNASAAAAEAAADAAAEAIDAANAATDAANLAAEAADAATVAAEEARDAADAATAAVEELATQVATLMAALKAQITTLANTVAKIAKKVKA
jgi:hypothetical protein